MCDCTPTQASKHQRIEENLSFYLKVFVWMQTLLKFWFEAYSAAAVTRAERGHE